MIDELTRKRQLLTQEVLEDAHRFLYSDEFSGFMCTLLGNDVYPVTMTITPADDGEVYVTLDTPLFRETIPSINIVCLDPDREDVQREVKE